MIDTLEQLIKALESGETLQSIATRNGVTKQAVSAYLIRNNINPREYSKQSTIRRNAEKQMARANYAQELFKKQGITQFRSTSIDLDIEWINKQLDWRSLSDIAAELGTTPQTIYRRFRALNIPIFHSRKITKKR